MSVGRSKSEGGGGGGGRTVGGDGGEAVEGRVEVLAAEEAGREEGVHAYRHHLGRNGGLSLPPRATKPIPGRTWV